MADCYPMSIIRFLKNNGLPIPPQTRAHHTAAFQGAPNPPAENIVMPSYKYSDHHVPAAVAEVQPVNVMQHVPPAWSLPDMDQSYNMVMYSDNLPTYSYNHLQLPAPEMNPSMLPVLPLPPLLPEEMFMHVPRVGLLADTYIQSDLVQLPTYSDDRVQVPSAVMHPAMQPVPPVLFPAENLPNLPENMAMHVPRYDTLERDAVPILSGLAQPDFNNHVELPAAELHHAMQPAPQELPEPPMSPPPVRSKRGESWTVEEHKSFLRGLLTYGRGDWRSISRIYVPSKTPCQIASHAQKYYLRQISDKKRKSIHDTVLEEEELNQALLLHHAEQHNHHHGGVAMVEEPHQAVLPHN